MAMSDHVILGGGPPFIFYCLSGNINVVHYVMVDMYGIYTKCLLYNNNMQTHSCFRCYITFLKTFYSFSVHLLTNIILILNLLLKLTMYSRENSILMNYKTLPIIIIYVLLLQYVYNNYLLN